MLEIQNKLDDHTLYYDQYKLALTHVEKLLDRRQSTTSFYLSVNTGIAAVVGLLLKDAPLTGIWMISTLLLLLAAGFIACWLWRSLLHQYEILLEWWYARLRELEVEMPDLARLITQEYQDLYVTAEPARQIGMTKRELALNWIFTGLYVLFAAGISMSSLTSP